MNYSFEKIEEDKFKLIYKTKNDEQKEIEFINSIDVTKELQSASIKGRLNMSLELTKLGITKKDLIIERKENNKTYFDNNNYVELEKGFIDQATGEIMMDIAKKIFGKDLTEIIIEMGLENDEVTVQNFVKDLMYLLVKKEENKFPSK